MPREYEHSVSSESIIVNTEDSANQQKSSNGRPAYTEPREHRGYFAQ